MDSSAAPAMPEWEVSQWFNTPRPIRVADLRGRVVLVHAFQMLCPGCVINAVPQARRVHELYGERGVAVIGLHTVFEHHDAMQPHALEAFLHEYGLRFPGGVDMPSEDGQPLPRTMLRMGFQGTPTTLVLDRQGRLRVQHFGHVDDLQLGVVLGQMLAEAPQSPDTA